MSTRLYNYLDCYKRLSLMVHWGRSIYFQFKILRRMFHFVNESREMISFVLHLTSVDVVPQKQDRKTSLVGFIIFIDRYISKLGS